MNTENQTAAAVNPFQKMAPAHISAGTVEIESSRAVAEAQGKLIIAKKFPRDAANSFDRAIEACKHKSLAESAIYSYPRGGEQISGPSIRLAEELARVWGNIDYGIRELSQRLGESEMEAYCWDLETNTFSSQKFTVKHERHTRNGVKKLTDPRDIYELTANQAGRRLRARILAVLPVELIEAATNQVRQTLMPATQQSAAENVPRILAAFSKFGVTKEMIEARIGAQLENITPENVADLQGIFNSLKDNQSTPAQWFEMPDPKEAETAKVNEALGVKPSSEPADEDPII